MFHLWVFLCHSSASLPTGLPLYYLTHPDGQVLTLGCPGARPDMAVAWDRGNEPIYRSEHSSGAGADPRLLIDTGHHLLFQPAQTQDSGMNSALIRWSHLIGGGSQTFTRDVSL